jgi:hypothetical protein
MSNLKWAKFSLRLLGADVSEGRELRELPFWNFSNIETDFSDAQISDGA